MIRRLSHVSVYVLDQDEAYDFYVNKLKDNSGNWFSMTQPKETYEVPAE